MPISLALAGPALLATSVATGPPECAPDRWGACVTVIEAYGRSPAEDAGDEDEARHAIATLENGCDSGNAVPCLFLANLEGKGVGAILPADRARARSWTARACRLGVSVACETLRRLDAPPLSAADVLGVRMSIVRRVFRAWPRSDRAEDRERPMCVAVASEADPVGVDPPASFFQDLMDLPLVRPLSWCRDHEQGDVLALGTVRVDPGWPPHPGVEAWSIFFSWHGRIVPLPETLEPEGDTWKRGRRSRIEPPTVSNDRADDRRIIAQVLAEYVRAWNEGKPSGPRGEDSARELRLREDTRLEAEGAVVSFYETGPWPTYAHVLLRLVGTFEPGAGRLWPIEPWKQRGAVSSVAIALQRSDGWWRSGHWAIRWTEAPWRSLEIH